MKTKIIGLAALAGLTFGFAEPADAHPGDWDIALHMGPAYVYYGNGFRRVDPGYRYGPKKRYRHFAGSRRHIRARDLWHRCFDGSWHPYYDRRHWRLHEKRHRAARKHRGHRHPHRHRHRHRHW